MKKKECKKIEQDAAACARVLTEIERDRLDTYIAAFHLVTEDKKYKPFKCVITHVKAAMDKQIQIPRSVFRILPDDLQKPITLYNKSIYKLGALHSIYLELLEEAE